MSTPRGPTLKELAQQALSSTMGGYDLLAPRFEQTPFRTPDSVLKALTPILEVRGPFARGLDLCCGTGAGLSLLRAHCTELSVGLDFSAGMLAQADARLKAEPGGPYALVRADVNAIPLGEGFDLVTCHGAFGHIREEDEPSFVKRVKALLRPGGQFVFYTGEPPSPLNPGFWLAHGFNAVMRVRNALIDPPFLMYYLTFMRPRAQALLEAEGFFVEVVRNVAPPPFHPLVLVIATRGKP
jgi:ubiquinone/menaquinone biosynthesis C-methylase UbiE